MSTPITPYIQPDAGDGADWLCGSWEGWPTYGSRAFAARLERQGQTLGAFKATPRYRAAVACGLIEGDRWTGRRFPIERPGWAAGEPLERQLRLRADLAFAEIRDLLAEAQGAAARMLYAAEIAGLLRGYAADRSAGGDFGAELLIGEAPPPPGGRRLSDQAAAWERAIPDASGPLVGALAGVPAPPICVAPVGRAVFEPDPGRIVVGGLGDDVGLRRAAAHWLGTVGHAGRAALALRAGHAVPGLLVPLAGGGAALPGAWVDADDARILGAPAGEIERALAEGEPVTAADLSGRYGVPPEDAPAPPQQVWAGVAGRFAAGRDLDLALNWEVWPEQVIGWLLVLAGAFVAVPTLGAAED